MSPIDSKVLKSNLKCSLGMGSFTNYVDKMRWVGGQSNVHDCLRKVGRWSVKCPRRPKTKRLVEKNSLVQKDY